MTRATTLSIDLGAIRANTIYAAGLASKSQLMACVKADAYGHGMVRVARAIDDLVGGFAVACLEEALALYNAGITKPVLLLEGVFDIAELNSVQNNDFWMVVHCQEQIDMLKQFRFDKPVHVWLKMDSGMHRLGFTAASYIRAYEALREMSSVGRITHMTHFCCAEELDNPTTSEQLAIFSQTCAPFPGDRSVANSAAIMGWPQSHHDWVRPGFMLYGGNPFSSSSKKGDRLRAAMTLSSEVISVRDLAPGSGVGYSKAWTSASPATVATVAVGYGDGYPRNTANGTPVLVNGVPAKTVGHVAMDMLTVDVTGIDGIGVGANVELWGQALSIHDVAASSGYSAYELMTRHPGRVPKIYT